MSATDSTTGQIDLARFINAQNPIYNDVVAELTQGQKQSHWMWFIFPQVAGLGRSAMAQRYAIRSRVEAVAYLASPLLAARLLECTQLVLGTENKSAHEIFGSPDDMKFRSSMTLFAEVDRGGELYRAALKRFFDGMVDSATLDILEFVGLSLTPSFHPRELDKCKPEIELVRWQCRGHWSVAIPWHEKFRRLN